MVLSRLMDQLLRSERDIREKLFIMMNGMTLIMLAVSTILQFLMYMNTYRLMVDIILFVTFFILTFFAIKHDHIMMVSNITVILGFFIGVPIYFFLGGGIRGGMAIWFLYAVFYISMVVERKFRYAYLVTEILLASFCVFYAYMHPEKVTPVTDVQYVFGSMIQLILLILILASVVRFEMTISIYEKERSEKQRDEIEEMGHAQSRFFSGMSHEIRTPINTIVGLNEMILREDISEEVAEDAANIRSACRMLLHLINDILDMSKLNSGNMELTKSSYSIGDMLSEIVGMLWIKAKEKELDFSVKVDPMLPSELIGDDVKIKQVLINLLTNAVKYTQSGSVVLNIGFERLEGNVINIIYTVTDTGMGIKKENLPHLFSAYQRVDEEKNRYIEGTGLGLSIVKEFVDLMNGNIEVESIYGKGSTFIVTIPQETIDDETIGNIDPVGSKSRVGHGDYIASFESPAARILVVDDNSANILVVTKLLRATKVKIDSALSGAEALKKTLEKRYDLVFMDHLMPEMDGVECMHRIRSQVGGRSKDAKIVALTANAGENNQAYYIKEGFDGYLLKPVTGEELEKELVVQLPSELIHAGVVSVDTTGVEHTRAKKRKKPLIITTEGLCDLPESLLQSLDIPIVRYYIRTDHGLFIDGLETDSEELVSYIDADRGSISSGPPPVEEYEQFFTDQLKDAQKIVHIVVARNSSSGYGVAKEAAKKYNSVQVVDSGHLSSGMGLVVLEAQRLAAQGLAVNEIISGIEAVIPKVHTTFVVDSTEFLYKSNRIGKMVYKIAESMMLHPVLELKGSKITVGRVIFGDREKTWKKYIDKAFRTDEPIDKSLLFITYVGLNAQELKWIEDEVRKIIDFEHIVCERATPAIAVNSGPGTFGLLYRTV